jgi:hypothetical protein
MQPWERQSSSCSERSAQPAPNYIRAFGWDAATVSPNYPSLRKTNTPPSHPDTLCRLPVHHPTNASHRALAGAAAWCPSQSKDHINSAFLLNVVICYAVCSPMHLTVASARALGDGAASHTVFGVLNLLDSSRSKPLVSTAWLPWPPHAPPRWRPGSSPWCPV